MIEYKDFYYWPTNDNRKLHIYLPQGYYESDEKYPVMYMFDGHNLFHDQQATYGKSWGLETFMDNYDKKMIIVGMECSHRGDERLDEYCPYNKRMFGHTIHGIGEKTFGWIIHDVKPYIDSHYRTYSHREATGIGGSSMGGIMSLYAGLAHSDVFSKCACLSTGIFWNLSNFRKTMKENEICDDTRIYMSWGEVESGKVAFNGNPERDTREARSVRKCEKELQEKGCSTYIYFQWGGRHCEADWEKQNDIYMNFLWK